MKTTHVILLMACLFSGCMTASEVDKLFEAPVTDESVQVIAKPSRVAILTKT